jgi:hypothetical protein
LNASSDTTAGPAIAELPQAHDALVVLDVDEVVLHFIAPFQELLASFGARLHFDSFKMTGNVRSQSTGAALTGHELDRSTEQLFREQERRQTLVAGARDAIHRLSTICDVVFLTAMPPQHYEPRRRLLDREGLADRPMIATLRSKGALIAEMRQRWSGPIAFVDDLPSNLEGVRRSVPDVHLLHLMADQNFRPHLPPLPTNTSEAADWVEAERILRDIITLKEIRTADV